PEPTANGPGTVRHAVAAGSRLKELLGGFDLLELLRSFGLLRSRAMTDPNTQTIRAVCPHDCPDACGMLVTVTDGKATALRGDPDHPFTKGFLCQKVSRYLDRVYHAERLQWPMKRVGPKGRGQFARISWDEAID